MNTLEITSTTLQGSIKVLNKFRHDNRSDWGVEREGFGFVRISSHANDYIYYYRYLLPIEAVAIACYYLQRENASYIQSTLIAVENFRQNQDVSPEDINKKVIGVCKCYKNSHDSQCKIHKEREEPRGYCTFCNDWSKGEKCNSCGNENIT